MSVKDYSPGHCLKYYRILLQPADSWYQWLDISQGVKGTDDSERWFNIFTLDLLN